MTCVTGIVIPTNVVGGQAARLLREPQVLRLPVTTHSSNVHDNHRFVTYYPRIVPGRNQSNVAGAILHFRAVVHNNV